MFGARKDSNGLMRLPLYLVEALRAFSQASTPLWSARSVEKECGHSPYIPSALCSFRRGAKVLGSILLGSFSFPQFLNIRFFKIFF